MTDFIRDPLDARRAIHAPSGRMAAQVFLAPPSLDFNPCAPTVSDLNAFDFIGFAPPRLHAPEQLDG